MPARLAVVVASLAAAGGLALAAAACSEHSRRGEVAGDVCPAPARSAFTGSPGPGIGVNTTTTATPGTIGITQPGDPVFFLSAELRNDGTFDIGTGTNGGAFDVFEAAGDYVDPATGADVVVDTTTAIPLVARATLERGGFARVTISPLSTLAWGLATGLKSITGAEPEGLSARANEAVSLYFTPANPALVPYSPGRTLWDIGAVNGGAGALSDDVVVGLVTAGLSWRAAALGITLAQYLTLLAADAEDGIVDGQSQPPLVSTAAGIQGLATVGAPLGATLAADIAAFLASSRNASGLNVATAQPLLDRLAASNGRLIPDVPMLTGVTQTAAPGSRSVTLEGLGLGTVAEVTFGGIAASPFTASATAIVVDAPAAIVSGVPTVVAVRNAAGFRHSATVTLTFP